MVKADPPPDRYALVGHPVHHSRSPLIHQLFARQTGQNLSYELIDAEPASFETAVRGFGDACGKGLNVTVPHKSAAFALAQELGDEAQRAEAVNTLTFMPNGRMRGDNTDGIGFVRDLTLNQGETITGQRILILGAGGAAHGILGPLLDARPDALCVANRTLERAQRLAEQFAGQGRIEACRFAELADVEPFDILINATSAGLKGEAPPFPPGCASPHSFCYDLAYSLKDTPFINWARARGVTRAAQGWGMLVEQAAESFLIWRGIRPKTEAILQQLVR